MSKKKIKTARDLLAELHNDSTFLEQQKRREKALEQLNDKYTLAESPLVKDLREAGLRVSSVWDLVNTKKPYTEVVPILLAHLDHPYPDRIREGIARALAVPEAREDWNKLVKCYLAEKDQTTTGVKWALHLAIAAAADGSVVGDLIRLVVDRRHGRNRVMFVRALARIGTARALVALRELESDPDLAAEVQQVVTRLG